MNKGVVLSSQAQADLVALDRSISLRVTNAIHRFAVSGSGNVKSLHGKHPPEFRLRVGDWRIRFHDHGDWIEILRIGHRSEVYG